MEKGGREKKEKKKIRPAGYWTRGCVKRIRRWWAKWWGREWDKVVGLIKSV